MAIDLSFEQTEIQYLFTQIQQCLYFRRMKNEVVPRFEHQEKRKRKGFFFTQQLISAKRGNKFQLNYALMEMISSHLSFLLSQRLSLNFKPNTQCDTTYAP